MKIMLRVLVILLAALVVIGVTYTVGQTDWVADSAQSTFAHKPPEGHSLPGGADGTEGGYPFSTEAERAAGAPDLARRPEKPEGLEHREEGHVASPLSAASLVSLARTLIPIAVVIIVTELVTKGSAAIRRRAQSGMQ